ncbi:MAG: hypothetical protein KUG56_09355 [Kordiimonadaceae bacterium]|nr:hypothetical protein [Kordiimonadaceae bacterium]
MKVALIGCVEFSRRAMQALQEADSIDLCGVITRKQSQFNADFVDLGQVLSGSATSVHYVDGKDQTSMVSFLTEVQPDVIFCVGWSYLLGAAILEIPPQGVIGYHPAALPKNRGRHPIIWALALGLQETASSFFMVEETADSGALISQKYVPIMPEDDAGSLYKKLLDVSDGQIKDICAQLVDGTLIPVEQDEKVATSWRKRTPADGIIDWRMSAAMVHNLVRALARPYPGAICLFDGQEIPVWKTAVADTATAENYEPGKLLRRTDTRLLVKCGEGAVWLLDHGFDALPEEGEYL